MKKRFRGILVLALALLVGYVAVVGASRYLDRQGRMLEEQSREAKLNLASIVVAAKEIPTGVVLTPEHLKLVELPKNSVPAMTFGRVEDVVGRVTTIRVLADDILLEGKLSPIGSLAGLQSVIPEGMRAITVKSNEVIGLGGFLSPGDSVDVIGAVQERSDSAMVTKTVLQNVRVLTVGQEMERSSDGKQRIVETVTLLVLPEEAERLVLVTSQGKIQLVLRSSVDVSQSTSGVTTFDSVLGRPKPAPTPAGKPEAPIVEAKPEPAAELLQPEPSPKITVEILRGSRKEQREFEDGASGSEE